MRGSCIYMYIRKHTNVLTNRTTSNWGTLIRRGKTSIVTNVVFAIMALPIVDAYTQCYLTFL